MTIRQPLPPGIWHRMHDSIRKWMQHFYRLFYFEFSFTNNGKLQCELYMHSTAAKPYTEFRSGNWWQTCREFIRPLTRGNSVMCLSEKGASFHIPCTCTSHSLRRRFIHPFTCAPIHYHFLCALLQSSQCAVCVRLMRWRNINFAINYTPYNIQTEFEYPLSINRMFFWIRIECNKIKEIVMVRDDRIPVVGRHLDACAHISCERL